MVNCESKGNKKNKIVMSPKSRNRANKTMVQFKHAGGGNPGSLSISDSLEQINIQTVPNGQASQSATQG